MCNYCPLKDEPHYARITAGGDRLDYINNAESLEANLLETKISLNNVMPDSDKGARFVCADIKDHFLAIPIIEPEYMQVQCEHIPDNMRMRCHLHSKVTPDS